MSDIRYENLGPGDYDRAKKVFDRAKHPGFVGRELFFRCASAGVACVAVIDDVDTGIALVVKDKLQALSVIVSAQGSGAGTALMARLRPKWVNAIGERIAWFEKRGYEPFGAAKVGQNGKHATQLMQRRDDADAQIEQERAAAPKVRKKTDAQIEQERAAAQFEGTALSPLTVSTLLACAERGVPKRMAAHIAGISRQTQDEWRARDVEPYATFGREWRAAFARAGASLIDTVAATDPKYLLGAVHRVRPTEKAEITGKGGKDLIPGREMTDAELIASVKALYTARHAKTGD